MSYKTELKKVRENIQKWRKLAEDNGWVTGHHITKYINKHQFADYMRECGKEGGMVLARKLTLREKVQKSIMPKKAKMVQIVLSREAWGKIRRIEMNLLKKYKCDRPLLHKTYEEYLESTKLKPLKALFG